MSNIIPPLVSSSPPPMVAEPDDLEDEFGDFTAAADLSSFEGYSLPTTPQHSYLTHPQNFIISLNKSCQDDDDDDDTTNPNPIINKSSENIFCDINTDVNNKFDELETHEQNAELCDKEISEFNKSEVIENVEINEISVSKKDEEETNIYSISESSEVLEQVLESAIVNDEIIENDDDDFDDFTDFKTAVDPHEDDFNDFNDESNIEFVANFDEPPVKNPDELFKNIFIVEDTQIPDCKTVDFIDNDVFKHVQDIENTHALSYHWTNSESQKTLLKALNIDSRNILFGPRWNVSMPRFAANLGYTPLEPMKSDINVSAQEICEVPDAKFDWNSSGLVNPLDYSQSNTMLLDLEQLVPNLEIPVIESQQIYPLDPLDPSDPSDPLDLDSWDFWLQQTQTEPIKVETIEEKLQNLQNTPEIKSDTESVNSLKFIETPEISEIPEIDEFNVVPVKLTLRETHISNVEHNPIYNLESFELESTVVTPDLPRKTIQPPPEEDDFNEFQMSAPPETKPAEPLEPLKPLKPIVLENPSTQINWPEPGIVSDDLQEFDFNFKQSETEQETSNTSSVKVLPTVKKLQNSASEEDDWSDFVSVQTPKFSKISNLELSVPNLQNTQLSNKSVLPPSFMSSPIKTSQQLSTQQIAAQQIGFGYQPPYQIPLQTPFGGLPQTSLSSFNNFSFGPTELIPQQQQQQPPKTPKTTPIVPQIIQTIPESHPFEYQLNSIESTFLKMQQTSTSSDVDDDDWTDFVSSQPVTSNGFNNKNFTPNIIANPVHFEAFQSYQPTTPQSPIKNNIPSISALPDLDFIAPKNKFFSKK